MRQKILTGIKPTGDLHLGNYIGAIKPALDLAKQKNVLVYAFIADSHSLNLNLSSEVLKDSCYKATASWLACGLDPEKTILYRQSDIPELFELTWILSCVTPKGLMNRAHAYKAKRDENSSAGKKDLDEGINIGLYNYPILMGADILLFSAHRVPVGQDQMQHLEMIRDIAQKWNRIYKKELFVIPEALILKEKIVPGLDGRKMSKTYNNSIPLFLESKKRQKLIRRIKTDSTPAEAPKNPEKCLIFEMYKHFAEEKELQLLKKSYMGGISWAAVKDILFEKIEDYFKEKQKLYEHYIQNPQVLDTILKRGQEQIKDEAQDFLKKIKTELGLGGA